MNDKFSVKKEWRLLLLSLGFFTRIPVPSQSDFKESDLSSAAKYFPLVGLLVGLIAALVYALALKVFPVEIAVILSMVATIYLTGAFHEDGLADATDGLGGGWEKEQVLTIMQDSRIGNFGAIALVLALLAKFQALVHLPPVLIPGVLIAGHALSRLAAVFVIFTQSYVRETGKAKPLTTQLTSSELLLACLFGLAPLAFLGPRFLWALLPVALAWLWFSYKLKQRIGGYTGDCLGAMQQLTEIAFYLGVLAWSAT
jgi:adenosylcobinamide-GDP ribazoletransferase